MMAETAQIVYHIHNSIYWLGLADASLIVQQPFSFGSLLLQPGDAVDGLGSYDRTSFSLSVPIKYCGMLQDGDTQFVLFQPVDKSHKRIQLSMFDEPVYAWYIAFIQVKDFDILLMQSSSTGFYDIRP